MKKTLLLFVFITQLLNAQTAIGPILTNPRALIIIDDFAYFEDNNQIKRLDLNNPSSLTTVIANLNITPYTFEEGPNGFFIPNTGGNNVVLATLNGTTVSPSFNYLDGTGGAIGFAFQSDNGDVYFTRNGTANSGQLRLLLTSPNSSSIVANLPASHTDITDVATIGPDFYFTSIQGIVWHYNINNPSAGFTALVSTSGNVLTGVEVTQNFLYYVNANSNRVVRVNRANGTGAVNLFNNLGIINIDIADNVVYGISSNQNQDRLYSYTDPQLPPACAIPNNITATVTNGTDALVTWDAVANANSYDVAYVETGQPIGNATVVNTTNTSQLISNLNNSIAYDIYVRTNCNSGTTNYSSPIQFGLPGIVYVDIDATGNNDGSSWADAYTSIEVAISNAVIGDEIWVAEGKYIPVSSYTINKRLTIYGGFDGSETQLNQRDFINNLSIFSGDLADNDDLTAFPFTAGEPTRQDNALRVIDITANDIVLDGISVRGAHDTNFTAFNAIAVDPSIQSFTLRNSEIAYHFNAGVNSGINMQPVVDATFIIDNNRFHSNQSNVATGIYVFTNSAITADVSIKNNLFYENYIISAGNVFSGPAGWVRAFFSGSTVNLELINNTFSKNFTVTPSGAGSIQTVFGISEEFGTMNATVENNIFWDNFGPNGFIPAGISSVINGGTTVGNVSASSANIDAQGLGFVGNQGQNVNPLFTDPSNNDFTLQSGSPAIDSGNNSFASGTDILGFQRIANGTIDMGAYEFGSTLSVSDVIQDKQFKIYPNPVVNSINVVSQHSLKNITIYSILGTKVLSSYENTIDVSNLKTGVYIMKIETIKGQIVSKRFIKE